MNTVRFHEFLLRGRKYRIDTGALFLYEKVQNTRFLWTKYVYKAISTREPRFRDLEKDRLFLIEKNRKQRGYCYLNISHDCNMKCTYCFAGGGAYGGNNKLMSSTIAKKAIDWVMDSCDSNTVVFNFFGGEPLVNDAVLLESINYVIKQSHKYNKNLKIIISTNGTFDIVKISKAIHPIPHLIAISLDGPAVLQNLNRPMRNGTDSYEIIADNIRKYLSELGSNTISIRATWRRSQSDLVASVQSFFDLGIKYLTIGRETSFNVTSQNKATQNLIIDFDEILVAYDNLAEWYIEKLNEKHTLIVQPLYSVIHAIINSRITRFRCTAGINKWCIEPDGEISACHRFVGNKMFSNGHITNKNTQINSFLLKSLALPVYCDDCWVKFWCFSNNCIYLESIGNDFNQIEGFCKHMKEFMEIMCYHTSNLTIEGRNTLLSIREWNN
jgi:uncharacterized protein